MLRSSTGDFAAISHAWVSLKKLLLEERESGANITFQQLHLPEGDGLRRDSDVLKQCLLAPGGTLPSSRSGPYRTNTKQQSCERERQESIEQPDAWWEAAAEVGDTWEKQCDMILRNQLEGAAYTSNGEFMSFLSLAIHNSLPTEVWLDEGTQCNVVDGWSKPGWQEGRCGQQSGLGVPRFKLLKGCCWGRQEEVGDRV